jgi:hypothetical protein
VADERWLDHVTDVLQEPVRLDPAFDERVMAAIVSEPPVEIARRHRGGWRPLLVSPIGGVALAAAVLAGILLGRSWLAPAAEPVSPAPPTAMASVPQAAVQFVIVAPSAATVSLVGDFNDWSHSATPMQRAAGDGVWSVTVPLTEGRYRYAFLVDGSEWVADPSAPRAVDDDFGPPNSVVTVGSS